MDASFEAELDQVINHVLVLTEEQTQRETVASVASEARPAEPVTGAVTKAEAPTPAPPAPPPPKAAAEWQQLPTVAVAPMSEKNPRICQCARLTQRHLPSIVKPTVLQRVRSVRVAFMKAI
ncbi:hypothetical protein WMY93_011379 [Mugilogobius chulae]|uniref:Uncharacterized protein n=1 Tax=Mugilogobius chulae TaxID=88201 RepID=A0AAW0P8I7_9GOBI